MINIQSLANGLTVIVEEMPQVESVAYELLVPGGIIGDDPTRIGASLILAELTSRGAGELDSHALSEAFDDYGIRHGEYSGQDRFGYRGSLLAEHLEQALKLVALMVMEPTLPESELENIKSVLLQDLRSLVDNPARMAMVELHKRYYPGPYCRAQLGEEEGILKSGLNDLKTTFAKSYRPKGSVISIAGNVKAESVFKLVNKFFSAWQGQSLSRPAYSKFPELKAHHISFDSAQLQIALAYPSASFKDPHYYTAKVAAGILSGGMFGRLFIEVREKRGLCYSVYARHSADEQQGSVWAYAGTTPERAQETLDVLLTELRALKGSVTQEELSRAKANIKSGLVIGEESSASRASSNAGDWWLIGRVREFNEILEAISRVSAADIDAFLDAYPSQKFMLLTLGSKELKI